MRSYYVCQRLDKHSARSAAQSGIPSGAAIPAAQITVTNVDTNATRSAVSNEVGYYTFPALPPGTYNLKAEKVGFKTVTRPDILIQVQQNARVDVELPVGSGERVGRGIGDRRHA